MHLSLVRVTAGETFVEREHACPTDRPPALAAAALAASVPFVAENCSRYQGGQRLGTFHTLIPSTYGFTYDDMTPSYLGGGTYFVFADQYSKVARKLNAKVSSEKRKNLYVFTFQVRNITTVQGPLAFTNDMDTIQYLLNSGSQCDGDVYAIVDSVQVAKVLEPPQVHGPGKGR